MSMLEMLSRDLKISSDTIMSILNSKKKYKIYPIPKKKRGEKRWIYQPCKEIKVFQYWIVKNVLCKFEVSKFSTAYEKGDSIKKNADIHKENNFLLHLDISNFFESISENQIDTLLKKNDNLTKEDIELVKMIVMFDGKKNFNRKLVIGSVASPFIANRIMYDIDNEIYNTCIKENNLKYTRYADDIYISSERHIDKAIKDNIKHILNKNGFDLNEDKCCYMSKSKKRYITGIVLDNNENRLSLGSVKYKNIKSRIYKFLIKTKDEEKKDNPELDVLRGYLALIKDLDTVKYQKIRDKYINYDRTNILFKNSNVEEVNQKE